MSIINHELQFQILLFSSTIRTTFRRFYYGNCDDTYYTGYSAVFNTVSNVVLNAACNVTNSVTCNMVYCDAFYLVYEATKKNPDKRDFDALMLVYFKKVLELDKKIQEVIETKLMTPKGYKSPRSELELVTSLLEVDCSLVSKMIPLLKVHWIYSIWCCAIVIDSSKRDTIIIRLKEIQKKLNLSSEYLDLLNEPRLEILDNLLLKPLTAIVQSYYGLIERELFISKLLTM